MSASDETEREGVLSVGVLAEQIGWAFREQPRPDRGVDAQIERRTNGLPDGRLLALQIKSGESRFRNKIAGGWRFYLEPDHVSYWHAYDMPVLLVLYNPLTKTAFWQLVDHDTMVATEASYAIDVPKSNVFDARSAQDLDRIADRPIDDQQAPGDGLRDRRMALDLPWMWVLEDGQRLYLEVDEKLNPQDGRCVLRLVAETESGARTTVRTWLWAFLPGQELREGLAQLFPWAEKAIDVPWYRQQTVADFLSEHGSWLPGEAEYELTADFNTWFGQRFGSGIAPYATSLNGTTALWRLQLTLNAVGREALDKDKLEMLDLLHADANAEDPQALNRAAGYYELRSIDATYSAHGYLDQLVFVNGEDEDGFEDAKSLLIEPRLMTSAGDPESALVDEILRHARGTSPTASLVKAFSQRFAADFDAHDGIAKIQLSDVDAWFEELEAISVDESGSST